MKDVKKREKVRVRLEMGESNRKIAKALGISETTVRRWKKEFEGEDAPTEQMSQKNAVYKEKFFDDMWKIIRKATTALDAKLDTILAKGAEDNTDVGKLASVISSAYEKQALIKKEATQIIEGSVQVRKFEDL